MKSANNNTALLNDWAAQLPTTNIKTVQTYRREIAAYLRYCDDASMDALTQGGAMSYVRAIKAKGIANTTINSRIVILRSFAAYVAEVLGVADFAAKLRTERIGNVARVEAAELKDVRRVLANETDEQTKNIIMLGMYLGLRSCEIAALKRCDLTKIDGELFVMVRGKGYGEEVSRYQPVPKCVSRKMIKIFGGVNSTSTEPVFTPTSNRTDRDSLNARAVQRRIREAFARCGVKVSSHQLRHAYALNCFKQTDSVEVVRDLMGHKQAATTVRYIHEGTAAAKAKVVNKIKF